MSQQDIHPVIKSVVARLGLTRRQSEIVCCVAMGLGMPELSQGLSISQATVRTHLRDIFRTLKVRSRVELVSTVLSNVLPLIDSRAPNHADGSTSDGEPPVRTGPRQWGLVQESQERPPPARPSDVWTP